jgi:hypothetical protein
MKYQLMNKPGCALDSIFDRLVGVVLGTIGEQKVGSSAEYREKEDTEAPSVSMRMNALSAPTKVAYEFLGEMN